MQEQVRPAVISHGADAGLAGNARFRAEFEWTGTRDITPWLCVPKAISYLGSLLPGGWSEVMGRAVLRVSAQLYDELGDYERLAWALRALL